MSRTGMLAGSFTLALTALVGCFPQETNTRAQIEEDMVAKDQLATIGQKTVIGNADPIAVHGVGLVYNLDGTGSIPAADGYRTQLEQSIRRNKGDARKLLDDPNRTTSLVLVSAEIPPGARIGDRLDVSVSLPPGSRTTSLKNGILWTCDLTNTELAANARQAMQASGIPVGKVPVADLGSVLTGHRLALAEGSIMAGYEAKTPRSDSSGSSENETGEPLDGPKLGVLWGGGKSQIDRPYFFILNENTPQPRLAMVIAERLNAVFQAPGVLGNKIADAKVQGRPLVVAMVPPAYRLNHARFLLVARQVPLNPVATDDLYRQQLEQDLLRPETAITTALKLEALGIDSRQPLRVGLQSDSPWVRFASAEALAYLGYSDGARDLAELAEKHRALRPQCLTALASLDDAVCLDQLVELMKRPDADLRYGAFVALRSADENHSAIRGKRVNNSYWVHQIAADTAYPAVHVATSRRTEIVLYGTEWPVRGPIAFPIGKDFTVNVKADEPIATITRITLKDGEPTSVPAQCKADAGAILETLGKLGATFGESVECISRLEKANAVTGAVAFDPAPRGLTVQHLAQIARSDPSLERADLEVQRVGETEVRQASYDTLSEGENIQAAQPPVTDDQSLNRDPGRLFGKRRE